MERLQVEIQGMSGGHCVGAMKGAEYPARATAGAS
jgi:hypothetical protein